MSTSIKRSDNLSVLITKHKKSKITEIPTDMQVLFEFLTLIVDIKYRHKYDVISETKTYINNSNGIVKTL